jgi:hypothetical protein
MDPYDKGTAMTSEGKEVAEPQPVDADDAPERLSSQEMFDQLQSMARQIVGEAPPAMREASAVAADLAAVAARNTGPLAHTIADITDGASLRFAERLEDYAANVRQTDVLPAETTAADTSDPVATDASDPAAADVGELALAEPSNDSEVDAAGGDQS